MAAVFWTVLAIAFLVLIPIVLVGSLVNHLRGKGSDRRGGGGVSAGVGAALAELDRVLARPSIEHLVETENPTLKHDEDKGGQ
jgi:hypothetical protein